MPFRLICGDRRTFSEAYSATTLTPFFPSRPASASAVPQILPRLQNASCARIAPTQLQHARPHQHHTTTTTRRRRSWQLQRTAQKEAQIRPGRSRWRRLLARR